MRLYHIKATHNETGKVSISSRCFQSEITTEKHCEYLNQEKDGYTYTVHPVDI